MSISNRTLSVRRQAFVEYLLQGVAWHGSRGDMSRKGPTPRVNATEAACKAGYAHPRQQGHRLLQDPVIKEVIASRTEEVGIQTNEILLLEHQIATASLADFIEVFEQASVADALLVAQRLGKAHPIRRIWQNKRGIQIDLYDGHKSRKLLGHYLGLW